MRYNKEYSTIKNVRQTLSKDEQNKKITGVCAGIAKYYDYPKLAVRIVTLISLVIFPVATGVAYMVASALLPSNEHY